MQSGDIASKIKLLRKSLGLTQEEFATNIGIKRSRLAMYEVGKSKPNQTLIGKLVSMGLDSEVGPPLIPASQLLVPVPYIGAVAASDKMDWTDPFESETFEYVPPEMGDIRGRFACRVASDSMMPLLEPGDVCVFQRTDDPKLGLIILFRSDENLVTIKRLSHDGVNFVLKPLNPRYTEHIAQGTMVGFLVGIVRDKGTQRVTIYDASGITP